MSDVTFPRLFNAGFKHLLPIIPHDATISEYSRTLQGREDVLGKNPGKLVSDGWVGFHAWQKHEPSAQDITDWHDFQAGGIGMRCHDVVAVDIDITDENLGDLVVAEALTHLGFAPTRIGNWPKRLMLFKLAVPGSWPTKKKLDFTDWNGTDHAVELLGAVQQFVVAGIHPKTRKPYTWDEDLAELGLDGLPAVEPEDIERFLTACREALELFDCEVKQTTQRTMDERDAEGLKTSDMALLAKMVAHIPNEEDTSREDFVSMAHAIYGAAAGAAEGLEIFSEWAERWPGPQDDDEAERVYRSSHGTSIGIQYLSDKAREHGFFSAADEFGGEVIEHPDAPEEGDEPDASADKPDSFWHRWVYINKLKRFVDTGNNALLDKENFNDLYVKLGDNQKPVDFFLEYRQKQNWADDVDYRPGDVNRIGWCPRRRCTAVNMWQPGPAQAEWLEGWKGDAPTEADLGPWMELGKHLFPDQEERDTLINWMASLIQRPGQKPNWHPLVGSPTHGTGKDSWFAPLVNGLGANVTTIKTNDLENQWTWWAENVQLVVVSEINSFERVSVMNRLKSYMAAPPYMIEINKKGQQQYEVPNVFGMVMFTNNEDAVALEKSDRRFYVVWSEAEVLAFEFYARYHEWLTSGGAETVIKYLMTRDLSDFSTKGNAPHTHAKEEMRRAALPQIAGLLLSAIEDEEGPFSCDLVTAAEVRSWLKQHANKLPSPHKMGVILRQVGAAQLGRARINADEGRQVIYAVRRTSTYQALEAPRVRDLMIEQRDNERGPTAEFG